MFPPETEREVTAKMIYCKGRMKYITYLEEYFLFFVTSFQYSKCLAKNCSV